MIPDHYLLFVFASVMLCIVPGPDMIFLLSRTMAQGRKAGMLAAFGINAGAYVHLLAAVLGLSALLAASAIAFTALKWIGAAYLVYLGVQVLMSKGSALVIEGKGLGPQTRLSLFRQGFLSDVLNPKVAIFFLAFLPQFVDANAQHHTLQILFLGCTVNVIAIVINLILVSFAGMLTARLRENKKIALWLNRAMGAVFIGLGVKLVGSK